MVPGPGPARRGGSNGEIRVESEHSSADRAVPAAGLAVLLTVLLGAGCAEPADPGSGTDAGGRAIPVVAAPVRFEPESHLIEAVGTSRAQRSVELHPESAGEVVEVDFSGGESVAAGELLVARDARDQRLAVQLAEVKLEDAQVLFRRYRDAREAEAVPPTTLDSARTALAAARIELDRARVALDHRFLRAPFAGIDGMTDVEPGDRVDPTTLITTLDDRAALLVFFQVPEAFVGRMAAGDMVEVRTWTAGRLRARGRVVTVGSRIDPLTRSFTVRARVPNDDDRLRPGMSFRVLLDLAGAVWPVVPEVSLQWGADGPYVWSVREGRAERVTVSVVQRREGRVLIDAALDQHENVVAEGVQRMRQGTPVRLMDPEALARDPRRVLAEPPVQEAGGA